MCAGKSPLFDGLIAPYATNLYYYRIQFRAKHVFSLGKPTLNLTLTWSVDFSKTLSIYSELHPNVEKVCIKLDVPTAVTKVSVTFDIKQFIFSRYQGNSH